MSFQSDYPWTKKPVIVSAPLGGFAYHKLAVAVSAAGGIGFIGALGDMNALDKDIELAKEKIAASGLESPSNGTLPIGVGFIAAFTNLDAAAAVVEKHKPAAVWFFAAKTNTDYKTWTERMRAVSPKSKIWIQNGLVSTALEIAKDCRPDVLVMQGSDAGGHGYEKGAGIISLVPETISALADAGFGDIKVVASGGIAEGRSAAAALALGASAALMGTRFLVSEEVSVPAPGYTNAVLNASDGGQATTRHTVFDELKGPNIWPAGYDGRSIVVDSYTDYKNGMSIDEVRRLHKEAEGTEDKGFSGEKGKGRAAVWAGTGVGFAKKIQSARDIVEEVRGDAIAALEMAKAHL